MCQHFQTPVEWNVSVLTTPKKLSHNALGFLNTLPARHGVIFTDSRQISMTFYLVSREALAAVVPNCVRVKCKNLLTVASNFFDNWLGHSLINTTCIQGISFTFSYFVFRGISLFSFSVTLVQIKRAAIASDNAASAVVAVEAADNDGLLIVPKCHW